MKKKLNKSSLLIRGILIRILIVSIIIISIAAISTYFIVFNITKEDTLEDLKSSLSDKVMYGNEIFDLARDNLQIFKEEYLKLYLSEVQVTEEEFWEYYYVDEDGATRMKREYFDGVFDENGAFRYGMSSFIGNNQPVDDPDFQRRLILAYKLLSQVGPAWINRFANVHTSFPENAITLFWPEEAWGLEARADLKMNELGVIEATLQENNPEREPVWTALYYDETANYWMITYEVPVDYKGKHLINPSHDVYLTDLIERLIVNNPKGIYNFIIGKDGYLVAHPADPKEEHKWAGLLSLDLIEIPSVLDAYEIINKNMDNSDSVQIFENKKDNAYLAVGEISEPEWWLVTVCPKEIITDHANIFSITIIIIGLIFLTVILFITYITMKIQAARPINQLSEAVEYVSKGEYKKIAEEKILLPVKTKNEIGLFAKSFISMAKSINEVNENLERIVENRTKELEDANASLRELSLLDGLTGIFNRRSLDRDLKRVFKDAKEGLGIFSILMADIDGFKSYNDTYGHTEGDKILIEVSRKISEQIRDVDRAYRYGGDEFAIIFNNADKDSSEKIANRIISEIRKLNIPNIKGRNKIVTLSAGIAEYSKEDNSPDIPLKKADKNLYESKNNGGNKVTI